MSNNNFHYKDGGESELKNILNSPEYDADKTWFDYRNQWNIFYHLSPERSNLLNWGLFEEDKKLNVLELGSGCGSITAALVEEENIYTITCVEGEKSRYDISKIRHKAHKNKVRFVNQNISDFQPDFLFDVVVVVGVLEYSGKYIAGDAPYTDFLGFVKSFLKPGGKLILAIENQLGHKYIAGADEDHYQRPYIGISDYNEYDGIRTFSKSELINKLKNVGFPHHKFYYPFPDYKLPKVILSDNAFNEENFDWLTLLDFPTDQHTKRPNYKFDEKAFLNILKENVDPGVFMNSFLIIASDEVFQDTNENLLAAKINTGRHQCFKSLKRFEYNRQGEIEVVESNFFNNEKITRKYYDGSENIGSLMVEAILKEDLVNLQYYLKIWDKLLAKHVTDNNEKLYSLSDLWKTYTEKEIPPFYKGTTVFVESKALDLIPNNILKIQSEFLVIDLEWEIPCEFIPIDLVKDRGMFWIINKALRISGRSGQVIEDGKWNVSPKLQAFLKINDHKSLEFFERWFQNYACAGEEAASISLDQFIENRESWSVKLKKWVKKIGKRQLVKLKKSRQIVRLARRISE